MGQAKNRGSAAQRIAEGRAKRQAAERQRLEALAAREAAMTPAQRSRRAKAQALLAVTMGLAAGIAGPAQRA